MWKNFKLGLVIALAGFALLVATQPSQFTVSRSTGIAAPPAKVFALVNDMHQWNSWSPWAKLDPDMKTAFDGPAAGVGAMETWGGNSRVGAGQMLVVKSVPAQEVGIKLVMVKPMPASNDVDFTFSPDGKGTVVTWSMSGQKNFVAKAFGLFVSMDKMVGGEFENGLANLKALAETPVKK
ncbi:MAG TPA: SRPBCC family protein [bacterium]|jgi:uncharacterized protein YndB with AHSA1/START domain|nr:SRPBCC family protein [bacterium]